MKTLRLTATRRSVLTGRQIWVTIDGRGAVHYRLALRRSEAFFGVACGDMWFAA